MHQLIHNLRRFVLHDGEGITDGQLLDAFIRGRDDGSFAALMRRHGVMVWGVCRRLLQNDDDAEDAFQATFLVLLQKAATIRCQEMVGNWLHGVAHQTAVRMRSLAAKRSVREKQVTMIPEPTVSDDELWNDLQPSLDEELRRLPEKYRVLIVLCDLEGQTRAEVARQLGIPEGTVAGRLARARAMLAARLNRRGVVVVSGGLLAALLSVQVARARVPVTALSATIQAARILATGNMEAVSPTVTVLITGVTKAMYLTKIRALGLSVLALALLGGVGAGVMATTQPLRPQAAPQPAVPMEARLAANADPQPATSERKPAGRAETVPPVLGLILEKTKPGTKPAGLLVTMVVDASPSAQAGIRAGDVITHIDKQAVAAPAQLLEILKQHKAGDKITLRVLCGTRTLDVNVELVAGQKEEDQRQDNRLRELEERRLKELLEGLKDKAREKKNK
jgi:RNA polymerase sigma factor (sigma-70 family)